MNRIAGPGSGGVEKSHSEPFGFAQDRLRKESLLAVGSSVPCAKDPSSASRRTQDDTAGPFFNSPAVTCWTAEHVPLPQIPFLLPCRSSRISPWWGDKWPSRPRSVALRPLAGPRYVHQPAFLTAENAENAEKNSRQGFGRTQDDRETQHAVPAALPLSCTSILSLRSPRCYVVVCQASLRYRTWR